MYENTQLKMLYRICATGTCERFSYYIMRGMVVLYLTKALFISNKQSYLIFANFSALFYLAPIFGGYIADKFIGTKITTLSGGLLLTLGYFIFAIPSEKYIFYALSIIVIGSGFFTPNIANIIGSLYKKNDTRREMGYSIFYAAINLGAFIAPIVISFVIYKFSWHFGFLLSAAGTLVGTLILFKYFEYLPSSCYIYKINRKCYLWLCLSLLITIPLLAYLIKKAIFTHSLLILSGILISFYILKHARKLSKAERDRLLICLLLSLSIIVFEALLQQSATSMTIFLEYSVRREISSVGTLPTVIFQAINPFFIICCAPILSKIWLWLENKKLNPSVPIKFGCGILLMGISFVIFPVVILNSESGTINMYWIILSYCLQSCSELFISPVGLSMISEFSPQSMIGLTTGIWYFSIAIAQVLGGFLSQLSVHPTFVNDPLITATTYSHSFAIFGCLAIISSLFAFAIPLFNRKLIKNDN